MANIVIKGELMYKYTSHFNAQYQAYDNNVYEVNIRYAVNVTYELTDILFLEEIYKRRHNLKDTPTLHFSQPKRFLIKL